MGDPRAADTVASDRRAGLPRALSAVLVVMVGAVAVALAPVVPGANEVVIALVLGLAIANLGGARAEVDGAVSGFMVDRVLKFAVILLGAGINAELIRSVGGSALVVIVVAIVLAIAASWLVGRWQRLGPRSALLVGVGTAICGASAIAAVAPVLRAKQQEIGVALAAVLSFNALALLLYPVIGKAFGFDPVTFGTWAGVAVHDTATAVATGFALNPEAGEMATVVKLGRILFLIPILAVLAGTIAVREAAPDGGGPSARRAIMQSIPWFVFGFAALALLNSLGWLGDAGGVLSDGGKLLIVFVVGALGLRLRLGEITHLGRRVFVTGFAASVTIAIVSLLTISALGIAGS